MNLARMLRKVPHPASVSVSAQTPVSDAAHGDLARPPASFPSQTHTRTDAALHTYTAIHILTFSHSQRQEMTSVRYPHPRPRSPSPPPPLLLQGNMVMRC